MLVLVAVLVAAPLTSGQSADTTVVIEGQATVVDNVICAKADWRVSVSGAFGVFGTQLQLC